jgi:hypothetical protein
MRCSTTELHRRGFSGVNVIARMGRRVKPMPCRADHGKNILAIENVVGVVRMGLIGLMGPMGPWAADIGPISRISPIRGISHLLFAIREARS